MISFLFDAPASDWIRFALFLTGILAFIFLAEKTRTRLGWSAEVTRKLVHVGTGVLIVFSPLFFVSPKPLLWMAVLFIAVNFAGVETGKLKGMHDTTRKSFGTVFYPLTFFILVLTCWNGNKSVLILAMMVLAFSDAAAAVVGELLKHPHEYRFGADKKSLEGSAAMFLTTFLLMAFFLKPLAAGDGLEISVRNALWIGFITAALATALESVSSGGSDNLTAPLGSAFILQYLLHGDQAGLSRLTAGLLLAGIVALLSFRLKFLSASGAAGTFILATLVFGIGGWPWAVPILVFFISSSLLSKIGKSRKKRFDLIYEKSSTRDIGQVFANGGVAGLLVMLNGLAPDPAWYLAYLGAVAAVNADTWATELGTFSASRPWMVTNFKRVAHGTSGAVSPLGLLSAFAASAIIVYSGFLSNPQAFAAGWKNPLIGLIILSGFLATLVDSLLGATIQAQYRCPSCGKITEKKKHCGGKTTVLASGSRFVDNDRVNLACSAAGALLVILLMHLQG
ncbi:DUF92 domain-containing protein [bacterium]|nr:DUF92 domain-containing protein [bacterium]